MEFFNREREKRELRAILTGEPNVIWFIYGPINSGKTALINKVIEELPEDYRVFYINFRGFEGGYRKFTRIMFKVGDDGLWRKLRERLDIISAGVEYVERLAQKINTGIVLPAELIRSLQVGDADERKVDLFNYLEEVMKGFRKKSLKPVVIFDELQIIKDEINTTGMPLLSRLFNFFVRITKEMHLCHCLCLTSDSLFIEEIYKNAHLEGRMRSFLVDDLDRESAFRMYEFFGFEEKELLWNYIGGKIGDMVLVFEEKRRGIGEGEAVRMLLDSEKNRLLWLKGEMMEESPDWERYWGFLVSFKDGFERKFSPGDMRLISFWVRKNVLFFDPSRGVVRPQGKLTWRAIGEVVV